MKTVKDQLWHKPDETSWDHISDCVPYKPRQYVVENVMEISQKSVISIRVTVIGEFRENLEGVTSNGRR